MGTPGVEIKFKNSSEKLRYEMWQDFLKQNALLLQKLKQSSRPLHIHPPFATGGIIFYEEESR